MRILDILRDKFEFNIEKICELDAHDATHEWEGVYKIIRDEHNPEYYFNCYVDDNHNNTLILKFSRNKTDIDSRNRYFYSYDTMCDFGTNYINISDNEIIRILNYQLVWTFNKFFCNDCNCIHYGTNYRTIGSGSNVKFICRDKFNALYEICEYCGKYYLKSENKLKTYSDHKYCESCLESHKATDPITKEEYYFGFYYSPQRVYIENLGYILKSTFLEHKNEFKKCSICGKYYYADKLIENKGLYMCSDCNNRLQSSLSQIRGYHYNPTRYYYGKKIAKRPRTFKGYGIELEVQTTQHDDNRSIKARKDLLNILTNDDPRNEVYFMRDGSIGDGFEIITQPHTEEEFKKLNWKDALESLISNRYRSHNGNACGLHIHSSRYLYGDTKEEQNDNIAKVLYFYEKNWEDMFKFSRRTDDHWCKKYAGHFVNRSRWNSYTHCYENYSIDPLTKEGCKMLVDNNGYGDRYYAVNCTNKNTIEFRIFRGTLVLNTFNATMDLTFNLVKNCKNISWEDIDDTSKWLEGISDTTKNYMKLRHCFEEVVA